MIERAKEKVKEVRVGPTYQCGGSLAGSPKSRFAGLRMLPFACLDPADADEERELKQLDVPDENLVELEGEDGSIDEKELKSWLIQEYGISSADFHAEFAPARGRAVLAFTSHRVARSMQNAPPPRCQVSLRPSFSAAALDLIRAKRPTKGATTDAVARRLIAGDGSAGSRRTWARVMKTRCLGRGHGDHQGPAARDPCQGVCGAGGGRDRGRAREKSTLPAGPGDAHSGHGHRVGVQLLCGQSASKAAGGAARRHKAEGARAGRTGGWAAAGWGAARRRGRRGEASERAWARATRWRKAA
ncbi:unnamed protein product [Effrenium voratum]|nr:unnamed protein product [Effrenium voratum]